MKKKFLLFLGIMMFLITTSTIALSITSGNMSYLTLVCAISGYSVTAIYFYAYKHNDNYL